MDLQVETVDRVWAFWRAWEAQGHEPTSVSIALMGTNRFIRAPEWLRPRLDADAPTDLESLVAMLGDDVVHVVGEARVAYADAGTLRPVASDRVAVVGDGDPGLAALEAAADPNEWSEASADKPCLRRFGVAHESGLLAVATLEVWDDALGHIGVFTAGDARRRGLASEVGSAAAEHALTLGSIPQWRSRIGNDPSARVRDNLGFVDVGRQMAVRVRASG